jgi:hypothetical protein
MTWHSGQLWTPTHALQVIRQENGDSPERFLLWVDGVGGFLVCLDDEIVLGQNQSRQPNRGADPGRSVAPARSHPPRRRVLDRAVGRGLGRGRKIHRTTVLADNDEIRLGSSVVLRFRQPHVLSSTARLELVSRHRTQPSADAILLMAESCVLGPKWQIHCLPRLGQRRGPVSAGWRLYCRATEGIEVDGRFCDEQAQVQWILTWWEVISP